MMAIVTRATRGCCRWVHCGGFGPTRLCADPSALIPLQILRAIVHFGAKMFYITNSLHGSNRTPDGQAQNRSTPDARRTPRVQQAARCEASRTPAAQRSASGGGESGRPGRSGNTMNHSNGATSQQSRDMTIICVIGSWGSRLDYLPDNDLLRSGRAPPGVINKSHTLSFSLATDATKREQT